MVAIKRKRKSFPFYSIPVYPEPTFHVMIVATGKPCLLTLLNSLRDELTEDDAITIIFDGEGMFEQSGFNHRWLKGHDSIINIIKQLTPLGEYGIRNRYQTTLKKKTTFIMHANDEDTYLPGSFDDLRNRCFAPQTLYIANVKVSFIDQVIPSFAQPRIQKGQIHTACGIIPFNHAGDATWAYTSDGDFEYYQALQESVNLVSFISIPIYQLSDSLNHYRFILHS